MKFGLFFLGLASATELYSLDDHDSKVAVANSVANAKGAEAEINTGKPPAAMSGYHWGLLDADSQLALYRKSEYRKKELENDIAHLQVDA